MIYNDEITNLVESLKKFQPKRVILFGSYARGDVHEASDIDVLIIKETEQKFSKRIDEVLEICSGCTKLEPLVYTPLEIDNMISDHNDFITTILHEGVVIYEQQS